MPTSRDVARVAQVSQSTVSYVMSGKRPISPEVRQRVMAAIEQLTYHPNAGARALASQRTQVIGLVVPFGPATDTTGLLPFIETITSGVREHDYDLLLVTADEGPSALTRLAGRALCDAIVLMEIEARDPRIAVAASLSVPVILIGVPDDPQGLPCVDLDFAASGRMAVEHLAATGHDRVVLLGYPREAVDRDLNYVRRTIAGFTDTATATGLSQEVLAVVEPTDSSCAVAVERALRGGGRRTGLVVAGTAAIPHVLHALSGKGLVPGRDVSVVGVCTDATAAATRPPTTNVSLEPRDVSRRAVTTLFSLLDPDGQQPDARPGLVLPRLTRRATTVVAP